jgi:hypothetical protein
LKTNVRGQALNPHRIPHSELGEMSYWFAPERETKL